jgi:plastocyanin
VLDRLKLIFMEAAVVQVGMMGRPARQWTGWIAICAVMTASAGCGQLPNSKNDAAAASDRDRTVTSFEIVIDNFTFSPAMLTVPVGATVHWVNRDDVPHTATSSQRPKEFDSGALDTSDRFAHQFTAVGSYNYFCAVHPHMTGQIVAK